MAILARRSAPEKEDRRRARRGVDGAGEEGVSEARGQGLRLGPTTTLPLRDHNFSAVGPGEDPPGAGSA
jgi:hypothetical protein